MESELEGHSRGRPSLVTRRTLSETEGDVEVTFDNKTDGRV